MVGYNIDVIAASPLTLFVLTSFSVLTVKTDASVPYLSDQKIVHRGGAFVAINPR